jgi:UDP-galactopyranose mutase
MYDYLIVGAGLFGSTCAYELNKVGKKVLVLEQRNHIGGNVYTEQINDIHVHTFGPHIFHTNSKKIWDYINQFSEFKQFTYRPKVFYENQIYSFPINLMTFYQLWGCKTPDEAQKELNNRKIKIKNPINFEEYALANLGEEIYQKFFYGYTKKQWMRDPKDLPASILKRLPIRFSFDENYFQDNYQGIPINGYTQIFEKMLEGVEVKINTPFEKKGWQKIAKHLIYSGSIDQFFDYQFGTLEYRTAKWEKTTIEQGTAVINFTEEKIPYTRRIQHGYFEGKNDTIASLEYPVEWNVNKERMWPIRDKDNLLKYQMYSFQEIETPNVTFGGRLGSFQYQDMHQILASALKQVDKLLK